VVCSDKEQQQTDKSVEYLGVLREIKIIHDKEQNENKQKHPNQEEEMLQEHGIVNTEQNVTILL
jgi:hypothetical protein